MPSALNHCVGLSDSAEATRGRDIAVDREARRHVIAGHAQLARWRDALQPVQVLKHLEDEALPVQFAVAHDVEAGLDLVGDGDAGGVLEHLVGIGRTEIAVAQAGTARDEPTGRGIAADAHGRQEREHAVAWNICTLARDDLFDEFGRNRLDIGRICGARVGHDGGGVRVDQHHAIAFLAQRLARLHPGIIELAPLANDNGT